MKAMILQEIEKVKAAMESGFGAYQEALDKLDRLLDDCYEKGMTPEEIDQICENAGLI